MMQVLRSLTPWCAWLRCSLVVFVAACSSTLIGARTSDVSRAEAYVDKIVVQPAIYWVDDERVVFQGFLKAEDINKNNQRRALLFDVRTKRLEDRGVIGGVLCYDDGYVRYGRYLPDGRPKEGESRWIAGRFGQEKPVFESPPPRPEGKLFDADWECRLDRPLPPLPAGLSEFENGRRRVVRLRPEHGFLEYAPVPAPMHPFRVIPPQGEAKAVTAVPPLKNERLSVILKFFVFKNAYLMPSDHPVSPLPEGVPQKLWWLYPNGRLEEIATFTRTKDWPLTNVTTRAFVVTKAGVVFLGAEPNLTDRVGKSGLYRLGPNGEPERLVPGRIAGLAVSPDGCKVAFGNDDRIVATSKEQFSLQVLNVCMGGQQ